MGHHLITEVQNEKFEFTKRARTIVGGIFLIGLVLTVLGIFQVNGNHGDEKHEASLVTVVDDHAGGGSTDQSKEHGTESAHATDSHGAHGDVGTARIWSNFLLNAYYFMLFAIAALFFLAVNYAANAGWATLLKRIMEAMSSYLWVGFVTILIFIWFGSDHIYHWLNYAAEGIEEGKPGYDRILASKSWFLNSGWFKWGVPIIIAIWVIFRTILRRLSVSEDANGGLTYFHKSIKFSAAFIFIFAFSFSILSWLLIMSIDAHWYSTIFSVYNFALAFVTGLTVLCFFTLYLKSKGYMEVVSDEVIHDVGKFMFAFSIFWGYIFLAQFLLIWYANIPEEVVYFDARLTPHYKPLWLVNIFMCFALPFLILMMRNAKRNPKVLLVAGLIILAGHWLDLYLMIMPGRVGEAAHIGMLEIGMTMAFAGFFIYWVLSSLSKSNLYAINHPYLLESANHDVGV
jgi:hypothetical protein